LLLSVTTVDIFREHLRLPRELICDSFGGGFVDVDDDRLTALTRHTLAVGATESMAAAGDNDDAVPVSRHDLSPQLLERV
jgi:hypothetical protein